LIGLANPILSDTDYRIGFVQFFWEAYWKILIKQEPPKLLNRMNPIIEDYVKRFNRIIPVDSVPFLVDHPFPVKTSLDRPYVIDWKSGAHSDDKDCMIILIRVLSSQILYAKYPSTKLATLEFCWKVIKPMWGQCEFGFFLDYCIALLSDSNRGVQAYSLTVCIGILEKQINSSISLDSLYTTYDYFISKLGLYIKFKNDRILMDQQKDSVNVTKSAINIKKSANFVKVEEASMESMDMSTLCFIYSNMQRVLKFNDMWYATCYSKIAYKFNKEKIKAVNYALDKLYFSTQALVAAWLHYIYKNTLGENSQVFYCRLGE
jgi:hypothetical protein